MGSRGYAPSHYSEYNNPAATAPPAPRAASVTSGRSATRRHRHARSHHGSSSSGLPQNEFPVFSLTGDVEIIITNATGRKENRYLLHRLILSQYSGFFEASTRDAWNRSDDARPGLSTIGENEIPGVASQTSNQDRAGSFEQVRKRWRYVLDWQNAGEEDTPMLKQDNAQTSLFGGDNNADRYANVRSKPPSRQDFSRSVSNFSSLSMNDRTQAPPDPSDPDDDILKDYDNLFRTMYQFTPVLDTLNIATAYSESKALLQLADMYDALEIVGSRVDHHLLRFGARLLKQIAKYPPSYLKLGYLARSRTIFSEALIHVVGQWPLAVSQLRNHIDAGVVELIEDKYDDLEDLKTRTEARLWRLNLTTSRGDRVTPSNDYLSWLAVSLFRQWFAENTTPAVPGILKEPPAARAGSREAPSGQSRAASQSSNHIATQRTSSGQAPPPVNMGRVYLLLGAQSMTAYLGHEELKRFLKMQPDLYTRENLRRFERRMEEVKHQAREAVRPLMRNFLELDLTAFGPAGLGYLTCTRVETPDLPWDD